MEFCHALSGRSFLTLVVAHGRVVVHWLVWAVSRCAAG